MTNPADDLAAVLRTAAAAIVAADQAADYLANPPPRDVYGVRIDWTWGTSSEGYKAVHELVRKRVENELPRMIRAAVDDLHASAMTATDAALKALS